MARKTSIRQVDELGIWYDEDERGELTIKGTVKGDRLRFEPNDGEPFELDLDELVEAILYIDQTGAFAHKILTPPSPQEGPALHD